MRAGKGEWGTGLRSGKRGACYLPPPVSVETATGWRRGEDLGCRVKGGLAPAVSERPHALLGLACGDGGRLPLPTPSSDAPGLQSKSRDVGKRNVEAGPPPAAFPSPAPAACLRLLRRTHPTKLLSPRLQKPPLARSLPLQCPE